MHIEKITSLLDELNPKLIVLLCHHNADPDAVCSAYAFSRLLEQLKPELQVEIGAAQGPSRLSKYMLKSLPITLVEHPRIEDADIIILLDTNTIQQLDGCGKLVRASGAPLVVIDHHARHPETESLATVSVTDDEASSTCEIIYRLFKESKVKLTETEARALFLGIAFDTRHFILASSATLKAVADLVDAGVNAKETLSLLSLPMESSERIARLKASQRARFIRLDDWMITVSPIGAYQASVARALVALGAHVAVAAGEKDSKLQVSLRACSEFYEKSGVHLGRDIAKPLGEFLHGMGGGHAASAGANGVGDVEACLEHCVGLLKEKLEGALT
jgi:nanoRNase/pAp phosphatase (c-di-AMP/oligoRNAs hydrolase)